MRMPEKLYILLLAVMMTTAGSLAQSTNKVGGGTNTLEKEYLLAPHDALMVKIYGEEDLSTRVVVNRKGMVNLPLLGRVKVGQLSLEDATKTIRDLYAKDFLMDPQVDVELIITDSPGMSMLKKNQFTMLGQVMKPGTLEIPPDESINLLQAIAMAGGYTRLGSASRIKVLRFTNGEPFELKLDAKAMLKKGKGKPFEVQPNDIITVGEKFF